MEQWELKTEFEWSQLDHSHGSAEDVPRQLENLLSDSADQRQDALAYFWGYMFHQGTRYEASPYVVGPLFDVIDNPLCPDAVRGNLIDFLRSLAFGYEDGLPGGYRVLEELENYRNAGGEYREEGLIQFSDEYLACREVTRQVERFVPYNDPRFPLKTRMSAVFTLAHFPDLMTSQRHTVAGLMAAEENELQLTNLILCFGMLSRYSGVSFDAETLMPFLDESNSRNSQMVRLAASIALLTAMESDVPDQAINCLLTAFWQAWEIPGPEQYCDWWNDGDLVGYAARALELLDQQAAVRVIPALCEALEKLDKTTFAIQNALIRLAFPDPKSVGGRDPTRFSDIQRQAAEALIRSGRWTTWMLMEAFLETGLTGPELTTAVQEFATSLCPGIEVSDGEITRRMGNVSTWQWSEGI